MEAILTINYKTSVTNGSTWSFLPKNPLSGNITTSSLVNTECATYRILIRPNGSKLKQLYRSLMLLTASRLEISHINVMLRFSNVQLFKLYTINFAQPVYPLPPPSPPPPPPPPILLSLFNCVTQTNFVFRNYELFRLIWAMFPSRNFFVSVNFR